MSRFRWNSKISAKLIGLYDSHLGHHSKAFANLPVYGLADAPRVLQSISVVRRALGLASAVLSVVLPVSDGSCPKGVSFFSVPSWQAADRPFGV